MTRRARDAAPGAAPAGGEALRALAARAEHGRALLAGAADAEARPDWIARVAAWLEERQPLVDRLGGLDGGAGRGAPLDDEERALLARVLEADREIAERLEGVLTELANKIADVRATGRAVRAYLDPPSRPGPLVERRY